jgi:hypothetical protein
MSLGSGARKAGGITLYDRVYHIYHIKLQAGFVRKTLWTSPAWSSGLSEVPDQRLPSLRLIATVNNGYVSFPHRLSALFHHLQF